MRDRSGLARMFRALKTYGTLMRYEAAITPLARKEIREWAERAAAISGAEARRRAVAALAVDASNAEAVAAFAALAPCRWRRTTIALLVSWQLLVDYIDALGEGAHAEPLAFGLRLGQALTATVSDRRASFDAGRLLDDGGYLAALVARCRALLWQLPVAAAVVEPAAAAAARCAEALAYTHAAARCGTTAQLRAWAGEQTSTRGSAWWEIAAAGNSNLAVLALLAAAADPATTSRDADALAAAYWPHICALSTLLDSLVDYERDMATGNFSFIAHYPDREAARRGLVELAMQSLAAVATLPRSHIHAMIVAGIGAFYATASDRGLIAELAPSVLAALRPTVTPILVALRAQRRLGGAASR